MSGGTIRGGAFADGDTFPTIYSGAVYITGGGTVFTMSGGTIEGYAISYNGSNGRANACGGGVMLWSGTFNMEGGTISGNSVSAAKAFGGGVYRAGGRFTRTGGNITDNTVKNR
jgi:hypothetical protein